MNDRPIALEDRNRDGAKLFSPSAGRNKAVIAEALSELLPDAARVLELGSGTGEHGAALGELRQDIQWQYSDPDAASRASQAAWAREGWPPPLDVDLRVAQWWDGMEPFDAIFSANMIHISPIEALMGLVKGAEVLTNTVILYGPFLFGDDSAPSNLAFDLSLRRRDPRWGVRQLEDVKHIFGSAGFNAGETRSMPRNNYLVRFIRS